MDDRQGHSCFRQPPQRIQILFLLLLRQTPKNIQKKERNKMNEGFEKYKYDMKL
jgi:hypothetical protein